MKDRPQQCRIAFGVAAASLAFAAGIPDDVGALAEEARPARTVTINVRPLVTPPASDGAFDWLDAAVGGGIVLGLVLVAAGASSAASRRSQQRVLADMPPIRKEHEQ